MTSMIRSALRVGLFWTDARRSRRAITRFRARSGRRRASAVSDWLMAGMKGDEFLVQAHRRFPTVVRIMLSGQAQQDAVDRVLREGGLHDFLAKPWNAAELVETINAGLRDKL